MPTNNSELQCEEHSDLDQLDQLDPLKADLLYAVLGCLGVATGAAVCGAVLCWRRWRGRGRGEYGVEKERMGFMKGREGWIVKDSAREIEIEATLGEGKATLYT